MPGTLNVGGHDIITHSGDAGAGDVTVNVQNRLVLDSSGNVGIGTSPAVALHIVNSDATFRLEDADTSNKTDIYQIGGGGLGISDGTTERIRIDSSGKVLVGTTSTSGVDTGGYANEGMVFTSQGQIQVQRDNDAALYLSKNTISFDAIARFAVAGSIVGHIDVTGSSTAYVTSSDYRLKENITEINDGITRVKQLNPSRFNFISDPDKIVDGFIAHEVQGIVPEAISGEKDAVNEDGSINPQGIDQSKLVPLLTAALQEAISKIEALTTRIEALENA